MTPSPIYPSELTKNRRPLSIPKQGRYFCIELLNPVIDPRRQTFGLIRKDKRGFSKCGNKHITAFSLFFFFFFLNLIFDPFGFLNSMLLFNIDFSID
ncbi:hypothetical protein P168DRAFT_750 [Aspergillus campestris IBT 28561]|uniref:Uncharacterized protein n=1 Tax=Aspergillus campestris (strain IBT 28561) TaxID=1392248 RepID=A0A2I1DCU6_ASPC2|nr:uncharacterized protein P168DRAFT_750 [Aspergillus campestris IBT 28561]PKY07702.1 hypothetical protein P168DRAFT_750 [Aspergillus campestris IBT 28561]